MKPTLEQAMKLLDRHHSLRDATEPRYIHTFLGKDTDEILKAYDEQPKQSSTYECPYCKLDILYGEYHDCKFGKCPPKFQDEQPKQDSKRIEPLRYNVSSVTDSKPLRFMLGSIQDTINELIERLNGGQE